MLLASIAANGDVSGASITVDRTGTNTSHKQSLLHLTRHHNYLMYNSSLSLPLNRSKNGKEGPQKVSQDGIFFHHWIEPQ